MPNPDPWTPLTSAFERDDVQAAREALEALGPSPRDENEATPLHRAARHGAARCVAMLLDRGADPLAEDVGKTIPLEVALIRAELEIARVLLDVPDILDHCPRAMSWAIGSLSVEAVDLLRARGVGLEAEALTGLLHPGERERAPERAGPRLRMLRALLDRRATLDAPDRYGKRPLQLAAELSDPDAVAELLARGATVTGEALISALFGLRLSMDAVERGKAEAVVVTQATATLEALLDAPGTDVDAFDDDGGTALSYAVEDSLVAAATMLLDRGATVDLSPTDFEGRTPLSLAAEVGHHEMVQLLLARGASPTRADDHGRRPAAHAHDPEIVALLQAHAG